MKRIFDIIFSILGIFLISPLFIFLFLSFIKNKNSPLYIAKRVGFQGKDFKMIKIRTMIKNADQNKVDSTSIDDKRITKVGRFLRKYKIDELTQLINILIGEMSFVGPRPNVRREIDIYTLQEMRLLEMKPGITDFASIVFADESTILKGKKDPDIAYNQLIRPGKSKLGLFYIENNNILIDISIILITVLNLFSRRKAIFLIKKLLFKLNASKDLIKIASREEKLKPLPPPGSDEVVICRTRKTH